LVQAPEHPPRQIAPLLWMETDDEEIPYIDIAKGTDTPTNASSTLTVPPHPDTATPPMSCTAGAPLQAPLEQLVNVDEQTRLIEPQLLKSMSRLTQEPDGCRT